MSEELHNKIKNSLESALELFLIHDYREAIKALKSAEVLDKNNPEILYNLGVCYSRLGLHKTAITYFKKIHDSIKGFIDHIQVKKLIAYSYIQIEQFDNADYYLDDIIKDIPHDITAHSLKGYSLEKRGRFDDAENAFRVIIDFDKQNSNAHNSLAYILALQNKNLDEAMDSIKKALGKNKENPAYLDTLGYIYLKKGMKTEAKKCFILALDKAPFSKEIKKHLEKLKI